jgi:hypothetical protein
MKNKPKDERDWHEKRIEEIRQRDIEWRTSPPTESAPSRETFRERTKEPGKVGLANEARPGLGTRAKNPDPAAAPAKKPKEAKSRTKPRATKLGYEEPRPAPREQPPNTMAHEEERSTGMSGQSSGT